MGTDIKVYELQEKRTKSMLLISLYTNHSGKKKAFTLTKLTKQIEEIQTCGDMVSRMLLIIHFPTELTRPI